MEQKNDKTKVYNVIIMDRSGSMWDIQRPAVQGFNEVLGGVKASQMKYADTQEQFISLILFDSEAIDFTFWNADPSTVPILTTRSYIPGASTPLFDAIGKTLVRLEKELKDDPKHSVAVTIITDGYENASREYRCPAVRAMIEHLTAEGWSFAYMGTDHDVFGVSKNLSITNIVQFRKTEEETMNSFLKERRARDRWSRKMEDFHTEMPGASEQEIKSFQTRIAREYYEEDI